jgi:hypothetical protein
VGRVEVGQDKGEDRARNKDRDKGGDKDKDGGKDVSIPSIYSSMRTNNCVRRKGKETEWWEDKSSYIHNSSFHTKMLN